MMSKLSFESFLKSKIMTTREVKVHFVFYSSSEMGASTNFLLLINIGIITGRASEKLIGDPNRLQITRVLVGVSPSTGKKLSRASICS